MRPEKNVAQRSRAFRLRRFRVPLLGLVLLGAGVLEGDALAVSIPQAPQREKKPLIAWQHPEDAAGMKVCPLPASGSPEAPVVALGSELEAILGLAADLGSNAGCQDVNFNNLVVQDLSGRVVAVLSENPSARAPTRGIRLDVSRLPSLTGGKSSFTSGAAPELTGAAKARLVSELSGYLKEAALDPRSEAVCFTFNDPPQDHAKRACEIPLVRVCEVLNRTSSIIEGNRRGGIRALATLERESWSAFDFKNDAQALIWKASAQAGSVELSASSESDSSLECGSVVVQGKAYNDYDLGNYLWGAVVSQIRIAYPVAVLGSELNGMFNTTGAGSTRYLRGDSSKDQQAIFDGYFGPCGRRGEWSAQGGPGADSLNYRDPGFLALADETRKDPAALAEILKDPATSLETQVSILRHWSQSRTSDPVVLEAVVELGRSGGSYFLLEEGALALLRMEPAAFPRLLDGVASNSASREGRMALHQIYQLLAQERPVDPVVPLDLVKRLGSEDGHVVENVLALMEPASSEVQQELLRLAKDSGLSGFAARRLLLGNPKVSEAIKDEVRAIYLQR